MVLHWSTHQLTEYFSAVSASADEDTAIRVGVERAVEALDAEVGALVLAGADGVRGMTGLPGTLPAAQLRPLVEGSRTVSLPGLGDTNGAYAALGSDIGGGLAVARSADEFSVEERQMLQGMAQVLGLALRSLRTLAAERALREERARQAQQRLEVLDVVRARQTLLETLLAIQRAISRREPLQSVLDAITEGASGLLGSAGVALVLSDPAEPSSLIVTSRSHWPDSATTGHTALAPAAAAIAAGDRIRCTGPAGERMLAAPVHVSDAVAGSLVAIGIGGAESDADELHLMSAFAQQISMALTDARTVEAMREAYRDPLTGLPNRKLFLERLDQSLADPRGGAVVVLFIDLDRFKAVNDSLGHRAGDDLLAAVSERIRNGLRSRDLAARLGGDEFAVMLEDVTVATARRVAERLAHAITEPFHIAGRYVYIGASVGIALGSPGGICASELLGNADVAMYKSKKAGSGQVVLFEQAMHAEVLSLMELQADLRTALPAGELRLVVQPLVHLATGRVDGVEALLRWQHPARSTVPPDQFVPIMEETGLINEVGRWVLTESTRYAAQWRRTLPDLNIAVNVSARQLVDARFVADVIDALDGAGLAGPALTLELTETVLAADPTKALKHLQLLKQQGVRFSVDDFGTGYSSLSYLRQFPVDQVKVDRSFVGGLTRSTEDRAVVRAIVDLGRALHLQVVAEGIETAGQLRALEKMGCEFGQGYHLHRPMEPAQLAAVLHQQAVGARVRRVESAAG
ncbi:MAG TPA: EAL domain-containing protein [Actinoplanes sp.]|nr:EAL domain-containing protein [Actinoplanes sp.]